MNEELKEYIGKYWIAYLIESISRKDFFEAIDNRIRSTENPDIWLIELSYLESEEDSSVIKNYVEEYLYDNKEDEFKFNISIQSYKEKIIDINDLDKALRMLFIDEEYGFFKCLDENINKLYFKWQDYPSAVSDKELLNELSKLV